MDVALESIKPTFVLDLLVGDLLVGDLLVGDLFVGDWIFFEAKECSESWCAVFT